MLNMAGVAKLLANTTTWANQASNPAWYSANLMNPNWPATIFMPTDQALTKLLRDAKSSASNQQLLDAFAANMPQFWQLMSNQVVDGAVKIEEGQEFTALGGEKLTVKKDATTGSWTLNGVSTVLLPGQTAGKTAIYSVDAFSTPAAAATWAPLLLPAAVVRRMLFRRELELD